MSTISAATSPLWRIDEELQTLLDSWYTCPEEHRSELDAKIQQYIGLEVEKVDRCSSVYAALLATISNANLEITRLEERKSAAERSLENLARYLCHVIDKRGGEPLHGRNVTFSARHTEAVVIVDEDAIPPEFAVKKIVTSTEYPKAPIKAAIKAGNVVPGAILKENVHLVRK